MPEYGRCIQQMVDHACTLESKEERQACAETIIRIMFQMQTSSDCNKEELQQKLWNHLAAMSDYKLDIDYPVDIEHLDEMQAKHESIPYPQKRIRQRHYGAVIESAVSKISEVEDPEERDALIMLVANQMKRSLAIWNRDAMTDEKVYEDMAAFSDGTVTVNADTHPLMSDREMFECIAQQASKKKKKKK